MELFRFLAWQWKRLDAEDITIALIILVTIVGFVVTFFAVGLLAALGVGAAAFITSLCFAAIFDSVLTQWNKYKQEKDREAQQIVDKLRGTRNGGFFVDKN